MPTILSLVGARPQFIKAGPVSKTLQRQGIQEILVHTGQHYDDLMSDLVMRDVGLREPDVNLGVGSGSHATQTARMLEGVERVLLSVRPDAVVTYGDTNSTLAGALAAAKLGMWTAHVEAGLRSFNRDMPEELNRIATDHLSDLLMAPTARAMEQLASEGLAERTILTGDVMVDALNAVDLERVPAPEWATGEFYAATIHRPSNTDHAERLSEVLAVMSTLNHPVHLLAHPRLQKRITDFGIDTSGSLIIHDPLPYSQMLKVVSISQGLLTDSGGLQKEAFILRVRCATIRSETEWPETLDGGWNVLAGDRLDDLSSFMMRSVSPVESTPFGDGEAASRIVEAILERVG